MRLVLPFFALIFATLFWSNPVISEAHSSPLKRSIWQLKLEPGNDDKFMIEGSVFAIGDPVHETLTLQALINGGKISADSTIESKEAVQFIRGVLWNDDPCAQLLYEDNYKPLKPAIGAIWFIDFLRAKNQAKSGSVESITKGLVCPLLGRSHFGDFQFVHAMANKDGEDAADTVAKIMDWASITYRIAIGAIDVRKELTADPTADVLLYDIALQTSMEIFRATKPEEARSRALGSLLHMVQDSYAGGHVRRASASNGMPSGIIQFLSYINQDSDKHRHDDEWGEGAGDLSRTLAIAGAQEALDVSTSLVKLYVARESWAGVRDYLINGPFLVRADAEASGAGGYE